MSAILAGLALGAAGGIVNNTVGYYTQKNLNRQQRADYQRNLKLSQQLNIEAQRKSIEQSTAALKNAGLSPNLAQQGNFSAPAASAPLGSSSAPNPNFDFSSAVLAAKESDLADSQKENIKANTEKVKAETESIKSKNPEEVKLLQHQQLNLSALTEKYGTEQLLLGKEYERKLSEDDYITKRLNSYIDFRIKQAENKGDEVERDLWLSLKEQTAAGLSLGTLAGMQRFAQYVNDLDEYDKEAVLRQVHRSIARLQLDDDSLLSTIAHMPEKDAALKLAQMAEALANRDFRDAYRKELIPMQKEKGLQDVEYSRHHDFVGMAKDGDIGGAAAYLLPDLLHLGGEVLLLRSLKGHPSGSQLPPGKPNSPKDVFKGSGFENNPNPPQKKVEQPKQLKLARLKKELETMRNNGQKYTAPKVYYDKLDEYERLKHDL